ncbi:MAG: hypothetical protein HZA15_16120 [Nitrospirae bacterium]|nr:hypothetical protein [Nitrospirota bacterium]
MKKLTIITCFFLLLFTALSLFLSSRAMAYDPKKDLVSAINLKATGLMVNKTHTDKRNADADSPAPQLSIPVNGGLNTFVDCSAPSRQDVTVKETTKDFRAVFGFQFVLK